MLLRRKRAIASQVVISRTHGLEAENSRPLNAVRRSRPLIVVSYPSQILSGLQPFKLMTTRILVSP